VLDENDLVRGLGVQHLVHNRARDQEAVGFGVAVVAFLVTDELRLRDLWPSKPGGNWSGENPAPGSLT
jgi:hypothetical protein